MPDRHQASQTDRVIEYIRTHPGASSLEITLATGTVNVTGRVSDARAAGHTIDCARRRDGRQGYTLRVDPVQVALFFAEAS